MRREESIARLGNKISESQKPSSGESELMNSIIPKGRARCSPRSGFKRLVWRWGTAGWEGEKKRQDTL